LKIALQGIAWQHLLEPIQGKKHGFRHSLSQFPIPVIAGINLFQVNGEGQYATVPWVGFQSKALLSKIKLSKAESTLVERLLSLIFSPPEGFSVVRFVMVEGMFPQSWLL